MALLISQAIEGSFPHKKRNGSNSSRINGNCSTNLINLISEESDFFHMFLSPLGSFIVCGRKEKYGFLVQIDQICVQLFCSQFCFLYKFFPQYQINFITALCCQAKCNLAFAQIIKPRDECYMKQRRVNYSCLRAS